MRRRAILISTIGALTLVLSGGGQARAATDHGTSAATVEKSLEMSLLMSDPAAHLNTILTVEQWPDHALVRFQWVTYSCVDDGSANTCTYEQRDFDGSTDPVVMFAPKLHKATFVLPVDYTITRWMITSSDTDPNTFPVTVDLPGGVGATVLRGGVVAVSPATVGSFSPSPGVTVIQTIRSAVPWGTFFGRGFGPATNDGSEIGSNVSNTDGT